MLSKYWRLKFLFLGLWGRTKYMLLRKGFHQVKVKCGSNQLAKVGVEDGLSLHSFFGYCQHMIELNNLQIEDYWCPCFISSFTLTLTRCDEPCCFNENLNWFDPMFYWMSCVKLAIVQQYIIHIHPCLFFFSHLVALIILFFPWNQNCYHCNQKERMLFTVPLLNARQS